MKIIFNNEIKIKNIRNNNNNNKILCEMGFQENENFGEAELFFCLNPDCCRIIKQNNNTNNANIFIIIVILIMQIIII